jgi:DNA-binding response OmpR family regulator
MIYSCNVHHVLSAGVPNYNSASASLPEGRIFLNENRCLIALDEIPRDRVYEFGLFRLSTRAWSLEFKDRLLPISKYGFLLLLEFLASPQTVIPSSTLVNAVWPDDREIGDRALPVYIHRLNRILSDASQEDRYIRNVRGKGYQFRSMVRLI